MCGTDGGLQPTSLVADFIYLSVTHFICDALFHVDLIVWVIFDNPDLLVIIRKYLSMSNRIWTDI